MNDWLLRVTFSFYTWTSNIAKASRNWNDACEIKCSKITNNTSLIKCTDYFVYHKILNICYLKNLN